MAASGNSPVTRPASAPLQRLVTRGSVGRRLDELVQPKPPALTWFSGGRRRLPRRQRVSPALLPFRLRVRWEVPNRGLGDTRRARGNRRGGVLPAHGIAGGSISGKLRRGRSPRCRWRPCRVSLGASHVVFGRPLGGAVGDQRRDPPSCGPLKPAVGTLGAMRAFQRHGRSRPIRATAAILGGAAS